MNLLPLQNKKELAQLCTKKHLAFFSAVVLVIIVLAIILLTLVYAASVYESRRLAGELSSLRSEAAAGNEAEQTIRTVLDTKRQLSIMESREETDLNQSVSLVFDEMAKLAAASKIKINSLSYTDPSLHKVYLSGSAKRKSDVVAFADALEKSGLFFSIDQPLVDETNGVEFFILTTIKNI